MKAEIIQALNIVDKNQSFSSASGDNDRFRKMFPDSDIARNYNQSETKAKYVIQFGIAPYINDDLLKDMSEKPFSFKFDETTTSQIKKQYDGYLTYFSTIHQKIITSYCGSLFVGHCTANYLLDHFFEFMTKLNLNMSMLLALGMDGPNVNKLFEKKLLADLEEKHSTKFFMLGSCPLHSVNNAFSDGLKEMKEFINLDQFAIDLHFFFKYSAARREDYKDISSITDIIAEFVLKHCQTRWLSIEKVLVRIIEQFENLKEYFLKKLPTVPGFRGKSGVQQTERYQRIEANLRNPSTLPYMAFIVHLAQEFKEFIIPLQSEDPKMHVLFPKCTKLIRSLLSKFLEQDHFMNDNKTKLLTNDQLLCAIKDKTKHKLNPDYGTHIKSLLGKMDQLSKKKYLQITISVLSRSSQYLVSHLPLDNTTIKDAKYIQPNLQQHKFLPTAMSRLSFSLANVLGEKEMRRMFKLKSGATKYDLSDSIKTEASEYQTEMIPESYYIKEDNDKRGRNQASYWKYAYGIVGIDVDDMDMSEDKYKRIDEYWLKVSQIRNEDGNFKYHNLWQLVRCILTLPHGNADPERGFSISKAVLDVHGYSTKEETIEALRLVKDCIIKNEGIANVKITKEMLISCENARKRYEAYLAEKRRQEMLTQEKVREVATVNRLSEEIEQMERDRHMLKRGIEVAEKSIEDGNDELGEKMKKKQINRDKLLSSQSKISMGVKRKSELANELKDLESKLDKK